VGLQVQKGGQWSKEGKYGGPGREHTGEGRRIRVQHTRWCGDCLRVTSRRPSTRAGTASGSQDGHEGRSVPDGDGQTTRYCDKRGVERLGGRSPCEGTVDDGSSGGRRRGQAARCSGPAGLYG